MKKLVSLVKFVLKRTLHAFLFYLTDEIASEYGDVSLHKWGFMWNKDVGPLSFVAEVLDDAVEVTCYWNKSHVLWCINRAVFGA